MAPGNPGEEETENTGHTYHTMSTLIIKSANADNVGKYTCVADIVGQRQTKTYDVTLSSNTSEEDSALTNKRSECAKLYFLV